MSELDTATPDTLREPTLDDGDHERLAHYVKKNSIVSSAVEGSAVEALCGKKWVPSRDPKKYPVCPECKEIFESLKSE
jgi:hypothetical protein